MQQQQIYRGFSPNRDREKKNIEIEMQASFCMFWFDCSEWGNVTKKFTYLY